jgi:hypothetical protein
MPPSGPPLGLAVLAAHLRASRPEVEVRCFDLNLAYYSQALAWLAEGRLRLAFKGQDQAATAARVAAALAVLTAPGPAFHDSARYDQAAADYLRFGDLLGPVMSAQARRAAAGQGLDPMIARFYAELLTSLLDFAPQAVGLSALFSQQLPFALGLARWLKDRGVFTMLGGATLSVMPRPERLLTDPLGKGLDCLMVGEGEAGLTAWLAGAEPKAVPGLVWRAGGETRATPPGMVADLAALAALPAPDFTGLGLDGFDLTSYHSPAPVLPYLGARGCFWQRCAFCTHRQTYLRYREEPAELTAARLAELSQRFGCRHFALVDEMIHPKRLAALSRELIRLDADLLWSAYARPEKGFTPELLGLAAQAGCRVLMWGLESASQRVLDLMGKGTHIDDVSTVLRHAQAAGIANLAFVMFGFPGETLAELQATLDFLDAHAPALAAVSKSRFLLLDGAPMLAEPARFGLTRVSPRAGDPLMTIAYDYETAAGPSQAEVDQLYKDRLRGMRWGWSPHLAVLRDHLLLRAARRGKASK